MKKLLIPTFCFLFTLVSSSSLSAQVYIVFDIIGKAERLEGNYWKRIIKNQPLKSRDIVRTKNNGTLTILDEERRKIYAVQSLNGGMVETLTASQRIRTKSMTQEAFEAVRNALFKTNNSQQRSRGGLTYKGDNTDELLAAWLHSNIDSTNHIHYLTYPIAIHAIDPLSEKPVNNVKAEESVLVIVENEGDDALFTAVVVINANGVWNAISTGCELIPPHATVELPYPIEFDLPLGYDHLLLLAHKDLFNPVRVVELYNSGNANNDAIEAGASILQIEVR